MLLSSACPDVTCAASGPTAVNDVWGCALRVAPGRARTTSGMAPTPFDGVTRGSNAGVCSRTVAHQSFGIGGFSHAAGSELLLVWVGTTSVDDGPRTSSSDCTTATAPPHTQPRLDRE